MSYEKLMEKLTPKYRLLIGAVLLVVGVIRQAVSGKPLDMYAFYLMAAAMICLVQVLIAKASKSNIDFILYLLINLLILIVGFIISESESVTGVVMYTTWAFCVVADWIANIFLTKCDDIIKRIVMGFVAALLNVIFIAIVFIVPILMAAFK